MKIINTEIKGLYLLEPELKIDDRGFFTRIFCQHELKKKELFFNIVQANLSLTKKRGTIRGMHFQRKPKEEDKIVQCLNGRIYDVVIDLRINSSTYGQWVGTELNSENKKMFFIPKGFAHGFQTLIDDCLVQYLMSELYQQRYATGVRWNDPNLNIDWPIKNPILSDKDRSLPLLKIEKNNEKSKE